jgi:hypothetical protein
MGSTSSSSGFTSSDGTSSSWNQTTGSSETLGKSLSETIGTNDSVSVGVNESQNWGTNKSQSWGQTVGHSLSASEQMDNLIEPNYFANALLSGGEHGIVTALWFRSGALFESGRNYMLVGFRQ